MKRISTSWLLVFADFVVHPVRPLELAEGEYERHERVLGDRAREALLLVAPVGDEDLLFDDAEAAAPGEASDQLYIVELEEGVEAPALAEQPAPDRDAGPGAGGKRALEGPGDEVEDVVEALHRPRGIVRVVQGAGDVEPAALEIREKVRQERPREPGVRVAKKDDAPPRPPAARAAPVAEG